MSVIDQERVAAGNPVSAGRLLLLVRRGIAATRRDLIRVTGLSRSTVTQRVDALLGAGLLRESAGEAEGRGRPACTATGSSSPPSTWAGGSCTGACSTCPSRPGPTPCSARWRPSWAAS